MADVKTMMRAERASLDEYLGTLQPEQWLAPTWCDRWNVQQVVGHLTAAAKVTAPHFFAGMVKTGFSFDKFVDGDLRRYAGGTPAEVRARFQTVIPSDRTPPGPAYVGLGEVMVHGEDIRRALGSRGEHPEEHLVTLAEAYRKTGAPLRGKKRIAGLKLTATDVPWSTGDGPEVRGPCMSVILAMVGRTGAFVDLEGDGVETLRSRAALR
jgi:uncharacterized protein (TIGR03083 family)